GLSARIGLPVVCVKVFGYSCGKEWLFGSESIRLLGWLAAEKWTRRKRISMNKKGKALTLQLESTRGLHLFMDPPRVGPSCAHGECRKQQNSRTRRSRESSRKTRSLSPYPS